ncbi:unnamed protein product [Bursaphelenchus okinawaensis]|uniref:HSA domain-containing protein n=1 Tax=Bursaphelenchus okinawaensis TaxID=465554 RepID=A0A811KGY0_9BILA|nr:unnamed protein product [Bursaphelenchus okinawaensis]CAG9102934.1 unnamed protein product [Bursaphelenchus okinawaensis]
MDTTKSLNDVVQLLLCQQIAAEGVKEEDLERLFKSFSSLPKHTPRYEPLQVITEKEKIISHKNEVPSSPERVAPLKPLIPSNNGINNGASTSKLDIISATSAAVQELEKQTWVPKEVGTYSPIQVFIDPPSLSSAAMSAQPSSSQTEPNDLSFIDLPEMNEQAVVSRICKLRSQGKWSLTRLPLCLEAPRQKVHHDYFLEEIQMMAVDFRQERDLKKKLAKMLAEEAADVVKAKQKENMQNEPPVESKKKRLKYFDLENKVISTLLENNWNEQVSSFEHAEEQQFVDSLNNPWYHGQIIEPDPFAYTDDLSPMEFMDDTQPLHDNSEAPDAAYFADSMGYSPKSSEDISGDDSRTVTSTVEQIEPTLDGFMVERTPPPQQRLEVVEPPLKKGTGQKKKHEDPSKRLYGNQVLVLADPNPLVKPDGKPGYTPTPYPAEWVEADVPPWTIIEDVCLLRTMVSQLKALPLPAYVARSFCVNWELITRAVRKVSFFHRTQFRCCLRFRELIGAQKKLAPTDNADLPSVTFDGLELPEVFDERVKGSTMPITR